MHSSARAFEWCTEAARLQKGHFTCTHNGDESMNGSSHSAHTHTRSSFSFSPLNGSLCTQLAQTHCLFVHDLNNANGDRNAGSYYRSRGSHSGGEINKNLELHSITIESPFELRIIYHLTRRTMSNRVCASVFLLLCKDLTSGNT